MSADPLVRSVALPIALDFAATVVFSMTGAMAALRRAIRSSSGSSPSRSSAALAAVCCATACSSRPDHRPRCAVPVTCLPSSSGAWLRSHSSRMRNASRSHSSFSMRSAPRLTEWSAQAKPGKRGSPFPACIFVGVVNATAGGVLRDVLVREEPLVFKPGQYYDALLRSSG